MIVSVLLAVALIWALLRRRPEIEPSDPGCWEIVAEDALKVIGKLKRRDAYVDTGVLATVLGLPESFTEEIATVMLSLGWLQRENGGDLRLTERGRRRARELVRVHRLWEQYLVEHEQMPPDAVHAEAHRREHTTTAAEAARLDAELGYPVWDPHGHAIPDEGSRLPEAPGVPLSECPVGKRMRVLHVTDEPAPLFAQLAAMGLTPGATLEVVGEQEDYLSLEVEGESMRLAPSVAEHVHVSPAPARPVALGELAPGSRAHVVETRGKGRHQRRMLDMGLVPGAEVSVLRSAPLGDPVEYRVKGAAISMRRSDANTVLVEEESSGDDD